MINCFQNPRLSVLLNKWCFNLSQNWKILILDFDSFSTDNIADKTLQALGFHISAIGYLEKGFPRFTDITELELNTEPAVVNNLSQIVTNFEEEVVKKKNKHVAKRKERLTKLYAPIGSFMSLYPESSSLLLPCFVSAPMPTCVPALIPALIFHTRSPTILSSRYVPTLVSYLGSPTILMSRHTLVFRHEIPALLLSLLSVLGLPLLLQFLSIKIFKQFLSDKPWLCVSTSAAKPFCPFLAFGAYNPTNNNERKRGFNTAFINSYSLAHNYNHKEMHLSFAGCRCLDVVKLNKLWQLNLLDPKLVCIIKAISLAATLFWDYTFTPYSYHTMKLAFKLDLKTNKIKKSVVKERIEIIWANRIVSLLDRSFRDTPKW